MQKAESAAMKGQVMSREEFIDLQIGALEARLESIQKSMLHWRQERHRHHEKLAATYLAGETNAGNNMTMAKAELAYWRKARS